MFDIKSYEKADTVKQAIELLSANPDAKLIAGGTDVLIRLREGHEEFSSIIDIHHLEEIKGVEMQDNMDVRIGAGMCFTDVIESEIIDQTIPIVAEASGTVGGPQVRNVATIGGNLCNGAISADSVASLCVLDATLEIEGIDGAREVPVTEFYLGPGKIVLTHTEILKSIYIKAENYMGFGTHYYKYAMRNAMDIATIGCAAAIKVDEGKVETLKLAFTVAAPKPTRATTAEQFSVGLDATSENIEKIAKKALEDLNPRDSWRASKDFRLHIIETLAKRVITAAIIDAGVQL
ncbi:MAG: xanthine dehydrogenase FAD-binding subunit XdhB [Denitrovibrio sp.]|nr:MAG: xanthine dehydrogenase FAD-binding subunit XdhB [Denitrovibrio sp.]